MSNIINFISIMCMITLCTIPIAIFLMLLCGILMANDGKYDGRGPGGLGPKCDICGKYLSEHNMYQCEMYC